MWGLRGNKKYHLAKNLENMLRVYNITPGAFGIRMGIILMLTLSKN